MMPRAPLVEIAPSRLPRPMPHNPLDDDEAKAPHLGWQTGFIAIRGESGYNAPLSSVI